LERKKSLLLKDTVVSKDKLASIGISDYHDRPTPTDLNSVVVENKKGV